MPSLVFKKVIPPARLFSAIGGYTVVVLPWYEVSRCDPEQLRGVLRARLGAVGNAQTTGEIG